MMQSGPSVFSRALKSASQEKFFSKQASQTSPEVINFLRQYIEQANK